MDVRHLLLLRELADRGTVAATAAALFVTPSAVSQQLRSAELAFGEVLVERDGRTVRLTSAGRMLAGLGVEIATSVARAERIWQEYREQTGGTVAVATLPSAGEVLLPLVVGQLPPDLHLTVADYDVAEAEYAALVSEHDLVIGHRMGPAGPSWEKIAQVDLFREPLDIALSTRHPLAGREYVRASDLCGERWIGVPEGYPFDALRIAIERQAGEPFTVRQRIRDNRLVESLVIAEEGIGLLPRFSTRPRPDLALVPLRGVRTGRTISLLARPDVAERGPVRRVTAALRAAAAGLTVGSAGK